MMRATTMLMLASFSVFAVAPGSAQVPLLSPATPERILLAAQALRAGR